MFVAYRLMPESRLRRLGRVPIASLADDQRGKIRGTVHELDDSLRTPLTGQPCVYYRVEARARVRSAAGGNRVGHVVLAEVECMPFALEDDTGTAIVDPAGARVRDPWSSAIGNARRFDAARITELLDRFDIGAARSDEMYFVETFIPIGETLDVIGAGTREADPDGTAGSYRTTGTRVRIAHTPRSALWLMKPRRT